LPLAARADFLDVPGGNRLALRVLALAGFHFVLHQYADLDDVALERRADFHRI
jgi:hypothetical protein